jgi:uncharacterized OB-fold protein
LAADTGTAGASFSLVRPARIMSYTVQRYRPKSPPYAGPEAFTPWPVGYVELAGETIVEARLTGVAFGDIKIGMALELTQIPLDPGTADSPLIHAFQPAAVKV